MTQTIVSHLPERKQHVNTPDDHGGITSAQALLDRLNGRLPGARREGRYVVAPCPECGGGDDRFFCGPGVGNGYQVFHCRRCKHSISVAALLGLTWQTPSNPAVKPWADQAVDPGQLDNIRAIYRSLATFAQSHLNNPTAIEYLTQRGLGNAALAFDFAADVISDQPWMVALQRAGIGYIDSQLYRQWWDELATWERDAAALAGLPDGGRDRFFGHAAMFAGGFRGKIVFPYYNDNGDVVDIRTRSISPADTVNGKPVRYTSPRGTQHARGADAPFGVQLGLSDRVVITEGEFKASVARLIAGVACLGLRGVDDWQDSYFDQVRGRLVILAFDNDKGPGLTAGQAATVKYARLLSANGIDVMVLDPALLKDAKGIDDFINAYGPAAFTELLQPKNLVPPSIFEHKLQRAGHDLSAIKTPRADVGTVRQWRPAEHVDRFAHDDQPVVSLGEAMSRIRGAVNVHLATYSRGNAQLLITAPAGVGKTTITLEETLNCLDDGQTVAVILPNHAIIDEKIASGELAGFHHVYGHNETNCQKADEANALAAKGYSPGMVLCPTCPFAQWCNDEGYKSQFKAHENRAYVHAHAFTNYPGNEDIVILDELNHQSFIDTVHVTANDVVAVLKSGDLNGAQRRLLDGINQLFGVPGLTDLSGLTFYETLEAAFPALRNVDQWGDAMALQSSLYDIAEDLTAQSGWGSDGLPRQFGSLLINLLSEDVQRRNRGETVTGRVRLVVKGNFSYLELTYSRGHLPNWFNTRPAIILNATADPAIMRNLCGRLTVVSPNVAIADGNTVTHDVTYNNAKSAYSGSTADAEKRRGAWLDAISQKIAAHEGGESDTTIIVAKSLAGYIHQAFPRAKVGYYHALEGRNDLQAGLTILASAVPINLPAIQREASALWPGIDTSLCRGSVAFDYANADGELLTTEQIDAVDSRLSALIAQHRDAAAVQAVHRSRIIRQSGRKVVVMFARPIPGLKPSAIITDRPSVSDQRAERKARTIDRLIAVAGELIAADGGFAVDLLAAGAEVSINTAKKYLSDVCAAVGLHWLVIPVLQPLANGAQRARDIGIALSIEAAQNLKDASKMHVDHNHYKKDTIRNVIHVHLARFLPSTWCIDVDSLLATLKPSLDNRDAEAPTPATLPGRWSAVVAAHMLKAALLSAMAGDAVQHAQSRAIIDYLNGRIDDRQGAYYAADALGVRYSVNWGQLRQVTEGR